MIRGEYRWLLLVMALILPWLPAWGAIDSYQFEDPEQAVRYHELILELRCLVCQNQSLADSDADLAKDLRNQVYDMIRAGNSNGEVVDYLVARYGDFVLYRPPLKPSTYLLWIGPFLLLALGALVLIRNVRKRALAPVTANINEQSSGTHREITEDEASR